MIMIMSESLCCNRVVGAYSRAALFILNSCSVSELLVVTGWSSLMDATISWSVSFMVSNLWPMLYVMILVDALVVWWLYFSLLYFLAVLFLHNFSLDVALLLTCSRWSQLEIWYL